MPPTEWKAVSPEEMIREIETTVRKYRENKYAFQTGLKDLDFEINEELVNILGLSIPFKTVDQAEQALRIGAIFPKIFIEDDGTEHQVLAFDHRPVGYSGFMDCVTHSLALTNHGLFEVGRYPAISLSAQNRFWQWFLHRRLANPEETASWSQEHHQTADQFIVEVYRAMPQESPADGEWSPNCNYPKSFAPFWCCGFENMA